MTQRRENRHRAVSSSERPRGGLPGSVAAATSQAQLGCEHESSTPWSSYSVADPKAGGCVRRTIGAARARRRARRRVVVPAPTRDVVNRPARVHASVSFSPLSLGGTCDHHHLPPLPTATWSFTLCTYAGIVAFRRPFSGFPFSYATATLRDVQFRDV